MTIKLTLSRGTARNIAPRSLKTQVGGDRSRAFTRNGHNWTAKYQTVVEAARAITRINRGVVGTWHSSSLATLL